MISVLLAAVVTCAGINDTTDIQAAVDVGNVELQGACVVSGAAGIRVPSDRKITMDGATVSILPGCNFRCKAFETVVGAANVKFVGGTIIGDRTNAPGLQWRIGIRIDSATNVVVEDVALRDWYTDGLYIGGNPPGSSDVTISRVSISNSKRNALSITCGTKIRVSRSTFETSNCNSGGVTCTAAELNMPMCGIDFEPNTGDAINDVVVMDSTIRGNQKCGTFLQSGLGGAGARAVFLYNRFEANGTIGLILNQLSSVTAVGNYVQGGTVGYSLGAGVRDVVFTENEVIGNTGNAVNFAGAMNPFSARNKVNGKPVAFIAISSPVAMNGVAGDVAIKPFE